MSRKQDPLRRVGLGPAFAGSGVGAVLTAARAEIQQATDFDQITKTLANLRVLETEAEGRRLALLMVRVIDPPPDDDVLNSKQSAVFLGMSLDWVYRNRPRLAPALVSPHDARQRYSKAKLQQLRESWSTTNWRRT